MSVYAVPYMLVSNWGYHGNHDLVIIQTKAMPAEGSIWEKGATRWVP